MKQKKLYVEIERIDLLNLILSIVAYPLIVLCDLFFFIIISCIPVVNANLLSIELNDIFNFAWLKKKEKIYVKNEKKRKCLDS